MKKIIITLLCIALLAGGTYFGIYKYRLSQEKKTVVDTVPINLISESPENFTMSSGMSGEITSSACQKVSLDNEKLVKKVLVKKGQKVKKGDVLFEYDMTVVNLELNQKKNNVSLIKSKIKTAENEIEQIKKYKPIAENKNDNDGQNYDYDPEPMDAPDEEPDDISGTSIGMPKDSTNDHITTVRRITASTPLEGAGTNDDPFIAYCSKDTIVDIGFMRKVQGLGCKVMLEVYEDQNYLYSWVITPEYLNGKEPASWCVSDGVDIDHENGIITLESENNFAKFTTSMPEHDNGDNSGDEEPPADDNEPSDDDTGDYDNGDDEPAYDDGGADNNNDSQQYTASEIKDMLREKEADLRQLKIDLKSAELEYKNAKKQKKDGNVKADIDGIVKTIGKAGNNNDKKDPNEDDVEEDPNGDFFAVVESADGVSIVFGVPEMELEKYKKGTAVMVSGYSGGMSKAVVTKIDSEPAEDEGTSENNPNNSYYKVTAKLENSEDFQTGDYADVKLSSEQGDTEQEDNSLFVLTQYIKEENGSHYIMKDDGKGKLKKQYVKIGRVMYGYSEITAGITSEDKLCFPYGKDIKEGTKTKDSEKVLNLFEEY